MKKILFLIAAASFTAGSFNCASGMKEGFYGDNAFRVAGLGKPSEKAKESITRRKQACHAALLNAQAQSIMKLADAGLESIQGKVEVTIYKDSVEKSFSGIVRGGRIIEERYDESSNECYVLYEIAEKDLKEKVLKAGR